VGTFLYLTTQRQRHCQHANLTAQFLDLKLANSLGITHAGEAGQAHVRPRRKEMQHVFCTSKLAEH
jgi:hypothetical protein